MSKNYNNNKQRKSGGFLKVLGMIAASILSTCLVLSVASFFKSTFDKEVNPENLIKYEDYWPAAKGLKESEKGLKFDWKDDGRIVISGKHADNDMTNNALYKIQFTTVFLDEGSYVFNCGNEDAEKDTFGVFYTLDSDIVYAEDNDIVFEVKENGTPVTFGIYVKNNKFILREVFEPTLVPVGEKVSFWK